MNEEEALTLVYAALERGIRADNANKVEVSSTELENASEDLLRIWKQQTKTAQSPGKHGAFLGFHYVILDQDLKLVETVASVMTTAAGVGFLLPELGYDPQKGVAAAVTGVIVALVKLFQNLQMSVHLDDSDYAIVALLSHAGNKGLSVQELKNKLEHSFPKLKTDALSKRLNALTMCVTMKGTKTALTWKGADERWRVNGV